MKRYFLLLCFIAACITVNAQLSWKNIDSLYAPLPASMHIYKSTDSIDGKPGVAYYIISDLKDKNLNFTTDTSYKRRLTPSQFFEKDKHPLVIVNASFFSFATNRNLNIVERDGKMLGYNTHSVAAKGKDTLTWYHSFDGALGISKKRDADIAWILSDSSRRFAYASESVVPFLHDSIASPSFDYLDKSTSIVSGSYHGDDNHLSPSFKKWKVKTAVGGGPVLVQEGGVKISNNEERKFYGKAINDRHPRTAIGYTNDHKLIILVAEGRSETASGLTLTQVAQILKGLGCKEALNLDGGGSTCMLVNGKQTNSPSDKEGQRAVPSVFIIERK
ncbi:MAG: phosphodiester glycosidase family protein [Ginsengibacter sp.]